MSNVLLEAKLQPFETCSNLSEFLQVQFDRQLRHRLIATLLFALVAMSGVARSQITPTGAVLSISPGISSLLSGAPAGGTTLTSVTYSGPASAAILSGPQRVAQDPSGNIYIADYNQNVIRKINTSGTMTTFAGTGLAAYSGNGGAASIATFSGPYCVHTTPDGSAFVCDLGNRAIRKISTAGIVSLIAGGNGTGSLGDGGPATAAQFASVHDLWIDSSSNVYLADYGNSTIRVVYAGGTIPGLTSPVVGNVYRIAGTIGTPCTNPTATTSPCGDGGPATAATIKSPEAIAVDSNGNIYITDGGDSRIRVIYAGGTVPGLTNPVIGYIYTVAGTGVGCSNSTSTTSPCGDGGLATSATVTSPVGLTLDGSDNIIFADRSTQRIRRIDSSSGIITSLVGGGSGSCAAETETTYGSGCNAYQYRLDQPSGIWLTPNGTMLAMINSYSNGVTNGTVLEKFDLSTSTLNFTSNQAVGSTSALQPITVSNLGSSPISLSKITISAGFSQRTSGGTDCAAGNTLNPKASCTLDIAAVPALVGNYLGTAKITSNATNAVSGVTTINLTGVGVQTTTTTALTISPNPANVGSAVTLTAKVSEPAGSEGIPTGLVSFLNGTTTLGTATLDATGKAVYTPTSLALGTYSITAVYAGDAGNSGSTSTAVSLTITSSPLTSIALTATPSTIQPGQNVVLKAVVSSNGGVPTGTVNFYNDTTLLANVALSGGSASYSTTTLPLGTNPITAAYPTSGGYAASTSSVVSVTVAPAATLSFIPGIINTVAGTTSTTGGYSGDGGQATAATLNGPNSVTVDAVGNYYIADTKNNVVRKVNTAGVISTIAGNKALGAGYSGDNGSATSAQLNQPVYARADASGNVYIADMGNHAIRVVSTSNIISTYAGTPKTAGFSGDGGAATAAKLNTPRGVAFDNNGNLLISDYGNKVVRRVDLASGIIQTIAGTPGQSGSSGDSALATLATLTGPRNVAADASGNIFIADAGGFRVRAIYAAGTLPGISSPVAGYIYTLAGTGTNSATGDGNSAIAATLGVADVALDSMAQIYVADSNGSVRKIDRNGIISTILGKNSSGSSGDSGPALSAQIVPSSVAFDSSSNIFLTDSISNTVRKVSVNASSILFPTQYINQTSTTQTVLINNTGTQPLTISAISVPSGFAQIPSGGTDCVTMTLASAASCKIAVTYSVAVTGTNTGTIAVTSNASNATSGQNLISLLGSTVVAPVSTTSLTITPNPAVVGQSTTFTATVKSGASNGLPIPTGTVKFLNGTTLLSTQALNSSSIAVYTTSSLAAASYSVTAAYQGDLSNLASTSSAVALSVVTKLPSTTALTLSTSTTIPGAPVTLTAVVTGTAGNPLVPGSIVQFMNGSTVLGQATLDSTGTGVFTTTSLALGTYSVTAAYQGDSNFSASTSVASTLVIKILPATTTVLTAPSTAVIGTGVTLSATVNPQSGGTTPTGTVTFFDGTTKIASVSLSGGSAVTTLTSLTFGIHLISATYNGDVSNALSTSANTTVAITNNPVTTLTLSTLTSTIASGATATILGQFSYSSLNNAPPTGVVTFTRASTGSTTGPNYVLGVAPISATGAVTFPYSYYSVGTYTVTASYPGDTNYSSVSSSPLAITVTTSNAVTVALSVIPGPATPEDPKTLQTLVTSRPTNATPTGTVTFYLGTTSLGTVTLDSTGTATLPYTPATPVGSYAFSATYSGDAIYPTTSSTYSLTVWDFTIAPLQTTLTGTSGGSVNTSFTVTPVNNFKGMIDFACSGLPTGASCSFSAPTLSPAGAVATEQVTISLIQQTASLDQHKDTRGILAAACGLSVLPIAGLLVFLRRRRYVLLKSFLAIACLFTLGISLSGCSSSSTKTTVTGPISVAPGTYTITVNGTCGADIQSATITLTVQ